MSNNELALKEAIRSMVDAIRHDPEYQAWTEKYLAESEQRQEQMYQDFEAIRNGTYKPRGVTNDNA